MMVWYFFSKCVRERIKLWWLEDKMSLNSFESTIFWGKSILRIFWFPFFPQMCWWWWWGEVSIVPHSWQSFAHHWSILPHFADSGVAPSLAAVWVGTKPLRPASRIGRKLGSNYEPKEVTETFYSSFQIYAFLFLSILLHTNHFFSSLFGY